MVKAEHVDLYWCILAVVKGSQFEYNYRHCRHNIHVAPLADNRIFSAANEWSIVTASIEKNNTTERNDSFITLCDNNISL